MAVYRRVYDLIFRAKKKLRFRANGVTGAFPTIQSTLFYVQVPVSHVYLVLLYRTEWMIQRNMQFLSFRLLLCMARFCRHRPLLLAVVTFRLLILGFKAF